jgi:hypothetical protein
MLHPVVPNGIVTHLYAGTAQETADYNGKVGVCIQLNTRLAQHFGDLVLNPLGACRKTARRYARPENRE